MNPSPVYPALHEHVYDPSVLVQVAAVWHGESKHSSKSVNFALVKIQKEIRLRDFSIEIFMVMHKIGFI